MTDIPKRHRVSEPVLVRKNMDMAADKLELARHYLGARTDTEAVDRALDAVIFQGQVFEALDRLAAAGGVEDIYARRGRPRRK